MWKLIVIYMNKYQIIEADEMTCRNSFDTCEYSSFVLYAFLFNDKQELVETFINKWKVTEGK